MLITSATIHPEELKKNLTDRGAGAYVSFEGWIRDQNDGQEVLRLEYEVYEPVAVAEGKKVIAEVMQKFPLLQVTARFGLA